MIAIKYPVALISTFLWIGFVCAISFMEAWLKFQAPGISIPLGLGIGKLVFGALNKVEWVFAIAIAINILLENRKLITLTNILVIVPLCILIAQTFWVLPVLDARAELVIHGETPPPSSLHIYYVVFELVKVACLSVFGFGLFKKTP